ncbi:hypothetical protein COU74_00110 [Candidatus Peregrinibacteria bacterium CG10_big_fil_rev_8_21_14_0_10_36_19]|nr:MAG: hypothetical protein COU74_00110 [Candidatus Peregrinibacteria bacterium CG10_big_fil_rev_8_21_14_0_10_36_19]
MKSPETTEGNIVHLNTPRGDNIDLVFVNTKDKGEISDSEKDVISRSSAVFLNSINVDTALDVTPLIVREILSGYLHGPLGRHLNFVIQDNTKQIIIPTNNYLQPVVDEKLPWYISQNPNGNMDTLNVEITQLLTGLAPGLMVGVMGILSKYNRLKSTPLNQPYVEDQEVLNRRKFFKLGALAVAGMAALPLVGRLNVGGSSTILKDERVLAKKLYPYVTRNLILDIHIMAFTLKTLKLIELKRTNSENPSRYTLLIPIDDDFTQVLLESYQNGTLTLRELELDLNKLLNIFEKDPMDPRNNGVDNHLNLVIKSAFPGSKNAYVPIGQIIGDPFISQIEEKKPAAPVIVKAAF